MNIADPELDQLLTRAATTAMTQEERRGVYAGAAHGWTVKGSQVYDEPAAEKAWAELLALYKRTLG